MGDNTNEFKIIKIEKKIKTISASKNIATVLGGFTSGLLIRNAVRNAEMHNNYGVFISSLAAIMFISGVVFNIVTANNAINKMETQIMELKK
jgi:hypothetical protein